MVIYCIKNIKNDKCYIGQTIQLFDYRKKQHKNHLKNNKHHNKYLQNSWNKYGEGNFRWVVLEDGFTSIDELNEAEKFWISFLRTTDSKSGYNLTEGGLGKIPSEETIQKIKESVSRPVCQYSLSGELIEIYDSVIQAARTFGKSGNSLSSCLSGRTNTAKGFQWEYLDDDTKVKIDSYRRGKVVHKYDLDGNYIETYDSNIEAAEENNSYKSNISSCCREGTDYHSCSGFQWSYEKKGNIGEIDKKDCNKKPIVKKTNDGKVIEKFESAASASRKYDVSSSTIRNRLYKDSLFNGYSWEFV